MKRKCRPYKVPLLVVAIIALLLATPIAEHAHASLTATQSLEIEWRADTKEWAAFGTLVIDLAAGPRWNWTYVHDAAWEPGGRWRSHDVSVSHYFGGAKDLSATLGVRAKVPVDEDQGSTTTYVLFAWRWGR